MLQLSLLENLGIGWTTSFSHPGGQVPVESTIHPGAVVFPAWVCQICRDSGHHGPYFKGHGETATEAFRAALADADEFWPNWKPHQDLTPDPFKQP